MMWLLGWMVAAVLVEEGGESWQLRVGERVVARVADLRFVWDARGERILSRTESPGWEGRGVRHGVVLLSDGKRQMQWGYEGGGFRRAAGGGREQKTAPAPRQIRLRQSSLAEFRKARPEAARNGGPRPPVIEERVEAWQRLDGRIWWAKGFYDGEGWTGVGGFGYFDEWTGERRSYSPPELVDWSVGTMLVERDSVWLALVRYGEWGSGGGGVWRFDRIREEMERVGGRGLIVREMERVGTDIVMATDWGAMVWDGTRLRRFAVDHRGELREGL